MSLYTEHTHAPAYYAAAFDKSGKISYTKNISKAFLDGRKLITSANGANLTNSQRSALMGYVVLLSPIGKNLAEAVFKYAGSVEGSEKISLAVTKGTQELYQALG